MNVVRTTLPLYDPFGMKQATRDTSMITKAGKPDDIAHIALFLASNQSHLINPGYDYGRWRMEYILTEYKINLAFYDGGKVFSIHYSRNRLILMYYSQNHG